MVARDSFVMLPAMYCFISKPQARILEYSVLIIKLMGSTSALGIAHANIPDKPSDSAIK